MFKRSRLNFNFFNDTLYSNTQPRSETSQIIGGRGNAGTTKFYNDAMRDNVAAKEKEMWEAYLKKLKGHQLEEPDAELIQKGIGRSNH